VDEFYDIHAISYDQKRKYIMKRTTKKRRITLYRSILITTEEKLITEHAKTSEFIGAWMEITYATLDKEKRDDEELVVSLKELEHLRHLDKYYRDTTQATMLLRREFQEAYNKFIDERHLFIARIVKI
jgi:hypothetical protein